MLDRIDVPVETYKKYMQGDGKHGESKGSAAPAEVMTPPKILAGTSYEILSKYNSTSVLRVQEFADFIFKNKQQLIDECCKSPELTVALYMAGVKFRKDALNESMKEDFIEKTEEALSSIHKRRVLKEAGAKNEAEGLRSIHQRLMLEIEAKGVLRYIHQWRLGSASIIFR